MGDTNYFSSIVKILETPKQQVVNQQNIMTTCHVQVPQNRTNQMISLVFWGKLGSGVKDFYKINDYILIEGYISLRPKQTTSLSKRNSKRVTISVLRVYPILLNPNQIRTKS